MTTAAAPSPAPSRGTRSRRLIAASAVAALLLIHYALAVGSKRRECVTSDEIAHLTGGYAFWKLDDYRLQPENGILPQRWEALPAWIAGVPFPALDQAAWRTSNVWKMGYQFFYGTGHNPRPMLMAARAMAAVFSVGLGLLIFLWSRSLFGLTGGFLSLALFVFSPEFLANGGLATSDVCLCLFMLASVGAWWRHLHEGTAAWTAASAAAFALTCVAKYSFVLLLPMFAVLAALRLAAPPPLRLFGRTARSVPERAGLIVLSGALHALAGWAVVWAFFGFRYAAFNPALPGAEAFLRTWSSLDPNLGAAGPVIHAFMRVHALPEAFLYGMAYVIDTSQVRAAFLNGSYSIYGWPSFFPWAFALKTTVPLMIACLCAAMIAARRWSRPAGTGSAKPEAGPMRRDLYRLAPLGVLFVIYWGFSIFSHLNIGHRHILPTYPVLYIAAGSLAGWVAARRLGPALAVAGLVAWQAGECAYVAPHFIAYFNELAGGPAAGRYHLADSSLDWGQDLPGLKTWLDGHARPREPVYLSYFGTGEPDAFGIRARRLVFNNGFGLFQPWEKPEAGLYCLGATMLDQVYGDVRGPWTGQDEKEYQYLARFKSVFERYSRSADARLELDRLMPLQTWAQVILRFDNLETARLCYYLRIRRPDAQVGWSIYIYRLSAAEVAAATGPSVRDWSSLIERTVAADGAPDGGRAAAP